MNYFQPSLKLIAKERQGAKVSKKYDSAKTPFQRILLSEHISQEKKDRLTKEYNALDPVNGSNPDPAKKDCGVARRTDKPRKEITSTYGQQDATSTKLHHNDASYTKLHQITLQAFTLSWIHIMIVVKSVHLRHDRTMGSSSKDYPE